VIHRFLYTLHGNHHRCITVYGQFTVFIVSVCQFFCIQFQRNRISENSLFHPERFCPVVHCINIRIQNDPGGKSHRIQDSIAFHIPHQKASKTFLNQFLKSLFSSIKFPVSNDSRQCKKQFFPLFFQSVNPSFHILNKTRHRKDSTVRIDSLNSICLFHCCKLFFCLHSSCEKLLGCLFFCLRYIFEISFFCFSLFPRTKHLFFQSFQPLSPQMIQLLHRKKNIIPYKNIQFFKHKAGSSGFFHLSSDPFFPQRTIRGCLHSFPFYCHSAVTCLYFQNRRTSIIQAHGSPYQNRRLFIHIFFPYSGK